MLANGSRGASQSNHKRGTTYPKCDTLKQQLSQPTWFYRHLHFAASCSWVFTFATQTLADRGMLTVQENRLTNT